MATLEEVKQMQQQGKSDFEITKILRDRGISPTEINESLSQSRIKSAISSQENFYGGNSYQNENQEMDSSEMQPSIMQNAEPEQQNYTQENYQPYTQEQEVYQNQPYDPQQYPQEQYQNYGAPDVETITEIADQIIEEKTNELKKKILKLEKFEKESGFLLEKFEKEMEKMKDKFNELQMAILKQVGEYGKNIEKIAKETESNRESFSKVINPLIDKARETK